MSMRSLLTENSVAALEISSSEHYPMIFDEYIMTVNKNTLLYATPECQQSLL